MKRLKFVLMAGALTTASLPVEEVDAGRFRAFTSFASRTVRAWRPRPIIVRAAPRVGYRARVVSQRAQANIARYRARARHVLQRTGRATGLSRLQRQRSDARVINQGLRIGKRGLRQHFKDAQVPEKERFWKKHNGVYHNEGDRNTGVRRAWKQERELVQKYQRGTRNWTKREKRQLLKKGYVPGYEGHHRNPVVGKTLPGTGANGKRAAGNPALARDPDNIVFLKEQKHSKLHASKNYQPERIAKLTPRDALARVYAIERRKNVPAETVQRARQMYRNIAAERLRQANRLRDGGSYLP